MNEELLKINDWFLANKLSLNLDNGNYILFKSHRKPAPKENPGIKIQDLLLNHVESTRFFGIHVDQHLTWKTCISEISLKIAKNIGIIHYMYIVSSVYCLSLLSLIYTMPLFILIL